MIEKTVRINVVQDEQGYIIGRNISDEWNLQSIGCYMVHSRHLDRIKATAKSLGFQIHLHKQNATVTRTPSKAEHEALGACGLAYLTGDPCDHDYDWQAAQSEYQSMVERGLRYA